MNIRGILQRVRNSEQVHDRFRDPSGKTNSRPSVNTQTLSGTVKKMFARIEDLRRELEADHAAEIPSHAIPRKAILS